MNLIYTYLNVKTGLSEDMMPEMHKIYYHIYITPYRQSLVSHRMQKRRETDAREHRVLHTTARCQQLSANDVVAIRDQRLARETTFKRWFQRETTGKQRVKQS